MLAKIPSDNVCSCFLCIQCFKITILTHIHNRVVCEGRGWKMNHMIPKHVAQ